MNDTHRFAIATASAVSLPEPLFFLRISQVIRASQNVDSALKDRRVVDQIVETLRVDLPEVYAALIGGP